MKIENIEMKYIEEFASMIYLKADSSGTIKKSNLFTKKILGFNPVSKKTGAIFVEFNENVDINKLAERKETQKLMSINTFSGLPQSFYFNFYKYSDDILIMGNIDAVEIENLRRDLTVMNNELNSMTRELFKKNEELKKLNELKNQFLGMAAHDLRRPVGAVISYGEFLQEEIYDRIEPEQQSYLDVIDQSANYMKSIIDDFLSISTIDSGSFLLKKEKISIEEVLKSCLTFQRLNLKKKGIIIDVVKMDQIPEINLDRSKIEHVMNNIISNSIEHSPAGETIIISITNGEDEIIVSIKDKGPGIPEEIQESIFKPYVTGITGGAPKKGGTGLGLVIARKIVDAHKGRIGVKSKVGKGSTFYFSLPLQKEGNNG